MNVAAFLSYVLLSAFSPGPNNIMAMNLSAKEGLRKGVPFCVGVFLGFLVDMTLCAVFTGALLSGLPQAEPVLKWIGVAYILILAWIVFRDRPHGEKGEGQGFASRPVATGVIMQFVNVKALLYGITAMSLFILPHAGSLRFLALAVGALSLAAFVATCCWALCGSLLQDAFQRHRKTLNTVMALLLVFCALSSLL